MCIDLQRYSFLETCFQLHSDPPQNPIGHIMVHPDDIPKADNTLQLAWRRLTLDQWTPKDAFEDEKI